MTNVGNLRPGDNGVSPAAAAAAPRGAAWGNFFQHLAFFCTWLMLFLQPAFCTLPNGQCPCLLAIFATRRSLRSFFTRWPFLHSAFWPFCQETQLEAFWNFSLSPPLDIFHIDHYPLDIFTEASPFWAFRPSQGTFVSWMLPGCESINV